jgi:hypothetical protein
MTPYASRVGLARQHPPLELSSPPWPSDSGEVVQKPKRARGRERPSQESIEDDSNARLFPPVDSSTARRPLYQKMMTEKKLRKKARIIPWTFVLLGSTLQKQKRICS